MSASHGPTQSAPLRHLPAIDVVLRHPDIRALTGTFAPEVLTTLVRQAVDGVRRDLLSGRREPRPGGDRVGLLGDAVTRTLAVASTYHDDGPRPVINATGIVLHTNLGRAPLAPSAIAAIAASASGYANVEYDLATGERGSRHAHLAELLVDVCVAEPTQRQRYDALVVNNCAGALLLVLAEVARGREVIVSRGHLVEIGGGFRIPDVMRQSGATLVEVGTTNRTRLSDYAEAIGPATAAILRVHQANFRIIGFTQDVPIPELAALARTHGVPLVDDIGSGCLLDTTAFGIPPHLREPRVQESITEGATVVLFSGDKLLGGPQAGVIIGDAEIIARVRRHPLARALRLDKLGIAALGATLGHYRRGDAAKALPIWAMIGVPEAELARRAQVLAESLRENGVQCHVAPGLSAIGGGSLPGVTLPTSVVRVAPPANCSASELGRRLRLPTYGRAIVGRIDHDELILDPRTLLPGEGATVVTQIVASASGSDALARVGKTAY